MRTRHALHSAGEHSAHELCIWLTVVAGMILCLWE
jgi:hypothetical protein